MEKNCVVEMVLFGLFYKSGTQWRCWRMLMKKA